MKAPVLPPEAAHHVHLFMEWAGLATGAQIYRLQRLRAGLGGLLKPGSFAVVLGCVLGAALGNKLLFWIEWPQLWEDYGHTMEGWMSGQSIVGSLLGGTIGVGLAKWLAGIREPTGDQFVLPLMASMTIARIGCFLAGLNDAMYGVTTSVPWGVDFGDGLARHPTQIYDILFVLLWGGLLLRFKPQLSRRPGLGFKLYLAGYAAWRLVIDTVKPAPYEYSWGLSGVQLVCIAVLLLYVPLILLQSLQSARPE